MNYQDVEKLEADLRRFSDVDLLLELRRRGRFGRVEAHTIVPGRYIYDEKPELSYPLDRQISDAYRNIGEELNKAHKHDRQPPGCKVERGRFELGSIKADDRKVTLVVNYVVGG